MVKNQIHSSFEEIRAEQKLKTDTKYFLHELYARAEQPKRNPRKKLILAPLAAMLAVILTLGTFITAVPVSAVSFDMENTSIELELNSLNKVIKASCFGEADGFRELELNSLDCETAVALIVEKAKKENADIASAVLTVNCKNSKKAERLSDKICIDEASNITISCHQSHIALREQAHSHGISTGKYQAYLTLKEYVPELSIEDVQTLSMSELKKKILSHTNGEATDNNTSQPHQGGHHKDPSDSSGKHHGQDK